MDDKSSDKLIRDKLQGLEFPYEPKAWEQMKSMLDEKNDRKGFFWWWATGVAALLLISITTTYFWIKSPVIETSVLNSPQAQQYSQKNSSGTVTTATNAHDKEKASDGEKSMNNLPSRAGMITGTKPAAGAASGGSKSNSKEISSGQKNGEGRLLKPALKEDKALKKNWSGENEWKKEETFSPEKAMINKAEENGELSASTIKVVSEMHLESKASKLDIKDETAEIIAEKQGGAAVELKQKERVFHYSFGAIANITGSIVAPARSSANSGTGANSFSNMPIRTRANSFYYQPSYMAGLTQEFMFLKLFAITNSVLYSQTSFQVLNPKTVSFATTPLLYSSNIKELNIAIGIKVYPVSKKRTRLYLGAGIINHIKLKETFAYTLPPDSNAFVNNSATNILPTQTEFSGSNSLYPAFTPSGPPLTKKLNTNDFSINNAHRYYTSFYATAGAEFVVRRHYVLFAESLFYMSLQKIGVQDMHKYNLGLSGGFRYQF